MNQKDQKVKEKGVAGAFFLSTPICLIKTEVGVFISRFDEVFIIFIKTSPLVQIIAVLMKARHI